MAPFVGTICWHHYCCCRCMRVATHSKCGQLLRRIPPPSSIPPPPYSLPPLLPPCSSLLAPCFSLVPPRSPFIPPPSSSISLCPLSSCLHLVWQHCLLEVWRLNHAPFAHNSGGLIAKTVFQNVLTHVSQSPRKKPSKIGATNCVKKRRSFNFLRIESKTQPWPRRQQNNM